MSCIQVRTQLSRTYIGLGAKTIYLMMEIMAEEKETLEDRLPLNLGFVLDRSGSMSGDKLAYTKQAVNYAANHFRPQDTVSLTVYDNEVEVLFEAQKVTNKDAIKSMINRVFPGGCTNLSGGLIAGYREVIKNENAGQMNRVLLLTDGLANEGITDKTVLCSKVREMHNSGVSVTTLGVGIDFDEDLLTAMAEASGGNYYFIENTDKIPQIFTQEMNALLTVVAQNVKLTFAQSSACTVSKVWGYQPQGDRVIKLNLPDLFSCDRKTVVMELLVNSEVEGTVDLGKLTLSYDEAGEGLNFVSCDIELSAVVTKDKTLLCLPENPEVLVQLELSRAAELKEEAIRLADAGDVSGAALLLKSQQHAIMGAMNFAPIEVSCILKEEYEHITESLNSMENKQYDALTRKKMAFQSYQRRRNQK